MDVWSKNHFLLRKLHQFTGTIPLGIYLFVHLIVNAYAMQGREAFHEKIAFLEALPFLPVWELLLIWTPLVYHSLFGIWVGWIAKNNPLRYPYARNWNFAIQRWTGFFMLIFVFYHAITLRFLGPEIGDFRPGHGGFDKMMAAIENPFLFWFYVVGILSVTYHFANGLWEFLIDWGFTVSPRAQLVSSLAMIVVFLGLSTLGINALLAFKYPVSEKYYEGATYAPIAAQKGNAHGR